MSIKVGELESVRALKAFHEDEDGMEALQVILVVALAAAFLVVIKFFWHEIKGWVRGLWADSGGTMGEEKFR